MLRPRLVLVSCIALAVVSAGLGLGPSVTCTVAPLGWRGQEPLSYASSDQGPFVRFFPELKSLPAPPWVREGLRAYYRTGAATIPYPAKSEAAKGAGPARYPLISAEEASPVMPSLVRTDVIALTTR
ncbi:MAG: hypothetical protein NUW23_15255, partial [Firmicutes bacterium]|nr:hypothetical protein [Bacillota bacterium]